MTRPRGFGRRECDDKERRGRTLRGRDTVEGDRETDEKVSRVKRFICDESDCVYERGACHQT